MRTYKAEGSRSYRQMQFTLHELKKSMQTGEILEAQVFKCDSDMNLYLNLGNGITGIIYKDDVEIPRANGQVKNAAIVNRVTRPTCFKVISIDTNSDGSATCKLSRRAAQEEVIEQFVTELKPGKIVSARVTHVAEYGAFCDIGCGVTALLPSDHFCMARFSDPRSIVSRGDDIKAVVKALADNRKIILSMKELLGTWEEEASQFKAGDTVGATVMSVEEYGVFVELTPNLAGLAEPCNGVKVGDTVSVGIKAIIPEKMKVKLNIVDTSNTDYKLHMPLNFHVPESGEITHWVYSPENSAKVVESYIKSGKYHYSDKTNYNKTDESAENSITEEKTDTEVATEVDE